MSSEEFEKLHEMYRSLYDELKVIPDRVVRSQGEEKKKLIRVFDERIGEAQEVVQFWSLQTSASCQREVFEDEATAYQMVMFEVIMDSGSVEVHHQWLWVVVYLLQEVHPSLSVLGDGANVLLSLIATGDMMVPRKRKDSSVNRVMGAGGLIPIRDGPNEGGVISKPHEFDSRPRARLLLQGMEQELVGAPGSFRNPMSSKVRLYHRDLARLQRDLHGLDAGPGLGRSSRPGDNRHGVYAVENERSAQLQAQRTLLLQGTEVLTNASQSIERSQRIAAETDQIGTDIIEELGEQREQLDRTRDRLVHTGENLSRSRKILRAMSRRVMTNKLLLGIIIILELAILGAVVYLKFFRR
ncbi:hypothetical protein P4O66_013287 [Electrophorus voltai]|uniref:t-SNARE coiled-coil homology domain-containing protein n=1 Tax=Electrophorus voltai TaxID=2609070 RepID=A0AAD8Z1G3_9TELE|nr:hypothetical protein P4O66_013287 [Electrophorus voltai]